MPLYIHIAAVALCIGFGVKLLIDHKRHRSSFASRVKQLEGRLYGFEKNLPKLN